MYDFLRFFSENARSNPGYDLGFVARLIAEDFLQGSFENIGKPEGQFQRRGVIPLLNGHDGLPGDTDPIG
jgi:hypothetical protein